MDWAALQTAGSFAKGLGSGLYAGGKSLVEGVGHLAQAGWNTATDPVYREQVFDRAQQLAGSAQDFGARAYQDPAGTAQATWDQAKGLGTRLKQQYDSARDAAAQEGRLADFYGQVVGRGGFEAAALFVPVSKLGAMGKAGTAVKTVDAGTDVARMAGRGGALAEEAVQLGKPPVAKALQGAAALEKASPLPAPKAVMPCVRSTNPTLAKLHLEHADEIAKGDTFKPKGMTADEAIDFFASDAGVEYLQQVERATPGISEGDLFDRATQHLMSGTAVPVRQLATEPLLKIVPEGAFKSYTPFWTTEAELQRAIASGKPLNEVFGLPMASDAVQYRVVRSTPPSQASVWASQVAPTEELAGLVTREGGARQLVVPDRRGWIDEFDAFEPLDNQGGILMPRVSQGR